MVSKKEALAYLNSIETPFILEDIVEFKDLDKYELYDDDENLIALALLKGNEIYHFSVCEKRIGIGEKLMLKIRATCETEHDELIAYCPLFNKEYAYFLEDLGFACCGDYLVMIQGFVFIYEIKPTDGRHPSPLEKSPDVDY